VKHRETPVKRMNPSGRTVWVARYTGPNGRRVSAGTFKRKGPCLEKNLADCCAQHAIDAAYQRPAQRDTLGTYLPVWLEEHAVAERTMLTNRSRITAVLDVRIEGRELRYWTMREIRRRHAKDLVAHMLVVQERAPEGARNILRSLSAMAEDAIADDLAEVNPWRGVKVRDDDKRAVGQSRVPRVWSFGEMHEFAAYAGMFEPMIRVMADCGPRIGEVFALRRSGLRAGDAILEIRESAWEGRIVPSSVEKNHDRDAPLPPGCLELLKLMPPRIDCEWLFPSPMGKLWRYSNFLRRVWKPAIVAANRDRRGRRLDPRPNEFRHSFVSHLRAAGIDPADLAAVAGHSEQTAAAHYTHALRRSDDAIRKAIG
jgi:integrase